MNLTALRAALEDRGIPCLRIEEESSLVNHEGPVLVVTENVFVAPQGEDFVAHVVLSPGDEEDELVIPLTVRGRHVDALEDDVRDAMAVMDVYGRMDASRNWSATAWLADAPEFLQRSPLRRACVDRLLRDVLGEA